MRGGVWSVILCGLLLAANAQESEDPAEVIVVDGESDDDTPAIVREYTRRDPRVRLVLNPGRIVPTGMNVGIRSARVGFRADTSYFTGTFRRTRSPTLAVTLGSRPPFGSSFSTALTRCPCADTCLA